MPSLLRLPQSFSSSSAFSSGARAGPPDRFARGGCQTRLRPAGELALHACVETVDADHDALMGTAADHLELIARLDSKCDGAAFEAQNLRACGDPQPDRRRRGVTDVEVDAQAL